MIKRELHYSAGYKYQLEKDMSCNSGVVGYYFRNKYYMIEPDGKLTVFAGCAWDGPSGPKMDTPVWMAASLFHDVGCWLIASGNLPVEAQEHFDIMLRDMGLANGAWRITAWYVYKAVRFHFRDGRKPEPKEILTAPGNCAME